MRITINGTAYDCGNVTISPSEEFMTHGWELPSRTITDITLDDVSAINDERVPVAGGHTTITTSGNITISTGGDQ